MGDTIVPTETMGGSILPTTTDGTVMTTETMGGKILLTTDGWLNSANDDGWHSDDDRDDGWQNNADDDNCVTQY